MSDLRTATALLRLRRTHNLSISATEQHSPLSTHTPRLHLCPLPSLSFSTCLIFHLSPFFPLPTAFIMAAWYKRKLQEDAALDATMGEVVEYDYFQMVKPPPPPPQQQQQQQSTDSPLTTTTTTTSTTIEPTRAFASNPNLTFSDWQTERSELRILEQCANQSALYIAATTLTTSTVAFLIARQRYGRSRIGALFTTAGVALFTASISWRVWGRGCAVDFLQSEGRVAERGRRRLREEMSDHPILIAWEDQQRAKKALGTASLSDTR